MLRNLSLLLLTAIIFSGCNSSSKQAIDHEPLVKLNYEQKISSTYDEVIANYQKLDEAWPEARLLEGGLTDCGKPLHLFVMSADRQFDPDRIRKSGKTIVMIMNAIHPGEPDGMEASMIVADDILRNHNGMRQLLDSTVVCIIPVYSIGGLLYQNPWHRTNQPEPTNPGYRGNAKNLDLNRDFVKLDTENAKSFVKLFRQWDPDVFLDTHATNGSDHQHVVTYLPAQHNSMPEPVGRFFKGTMIPAMYKKMATTPYPMIPYAEYTNQSPEEGIESYVQTPRFSTGYTLLFHSLPQMIENLCYQPYVDRVKGLYHFIITMIGFSNENTDAILQVREESRQMAKTKREFPLDYELDSSKFETIEFRGFERGTDISPLTGEVRSIYDYSKPFTTTIPFYDEYKPSKMVTAPNFYVVPQAWSEVIERLKINQIEMIRLDRDSLMEVEVYYIDNLVWSARPSNGHHFHDRFTTRKEIQRIQYYRGDYLVPVNQESNYFIVNMLEPEAPDSYFRWNFFDPCLEDREWFSPHPVLEDRIFAYLNENPGARRLLDEAVAADPKLAGNRMAQMYFAYTKLGLANKWVARYPVARLN